MRVLALRALGVGDLCAAVPAIRGLARAFPDDELQLAAPATLAPLLPYLATHATLVDQRGIDGPLPEALHGPTLAVNLHGRGPRSTSLLEVVAPQVLIAYERESPFGPAITWDEHEHERERWCRLLQAHGIDADPDDLRFTPRRTPRPGPRSVVVHAGASAAARCWPAERWAAIVAHLCDLDVTVALTGSHQEQARTATIAELVGRPAQVIDLAGRTPLDELAEIVARAPLVVSGDTGIAHLAFAFGTPTVTLYGPVSPLCWGPPHTAAHVTLWCGRHGDPNADAPDPGLLAIDVAQVAHACDRQLDAAGTAR